MTAQKVKRDTKSAWLWRLAIPVYLATILIILGPALLNITTRSLTHLALAQGRPDLAEMCIGAVMLLKPKSARLYDTLGYAQYAQGKSTAALASFRQALALDESYSVTQNNLGVALFDQGESSQAVTYLQAAVGADPGNARIYYNLANALVASGDTQAAGDAYRLAFELAPDQLDALADWAALALQDGQIDQARQTWQQILAQDPNHALAHRGLGVIAYMEQDYSEAIADLQVAEKFDPYDPITRFYMGLALKSSGDLEKARVEFERAAFLGSDPELVSQAEAYAQALR
jgi:tetratricopeptide (TPR) repeat protein